MMGEHSQEENPLSLSGLWLIWPVNVKRGGQHGDIGKESLTPKLPHSPSYFRGEGKEDNPTLG